MLNTNADSVSRSVAIDYANLTIYELNVLNDHRKPVGPGNSAPRTAQRACMLHILRCFIALLVRIVRLNLNYKEQNYMQRYEPESQPARPKLIASHVDIPAVAASCNPTLLVAQGLRERLESIATIFPHRPIGVGSVSISKQDHDEYLLFTAAVIKAGKVDLRLRPSGVASFFVVGKPGRDRLRPMRHA